MSIIKSIRTPTGINVSYHRTTKMDVDLLSESVTLTIESHGDEEAAIAKTPPFIWRYNFPITVFSKVGDLKTNVELALISQDDLPFAGGDIIVDQIDTIEGVKSRKNAEINGAQAKASSTFIYDNVQFDADAGSVAKMNTANGLIALTGTVPEDWRGAWKASDNSFYPIADVATWTLFYTAFCKRVQDNFNQAQDLKAALEAATTFEEVNNIKWDYNR